MYSLFKSSGIISEVSHTHENKSVIDLFTETEGQPLYDGSPILAGIETGSAGVIFCSSQEYADLTEINPSAFYLVEDETAPDPEDPGEEEPPAAVAVTGVTLNKTSASLTAGGTETLTASVTPSNASNQAVTWSSSDTQAATVAGGIVTGTGAGTALITATTVDGGFTASCSVTVSALKGLWQGTKTANGITVAISGNHVTINGTKTTADSALGSGYLTDNEAVLFVAPAAWHTFAAGSQISLIVSNVTGTVTYNTNTANTQSCGLRRTDNTVLAGATWGNPAGTFTYLCVVPTPVYGLMFYLQTGETAVNYGFDVEFWVDGVRWI